MISIVMSYKNRLSQLERTLDSIKKSIIKDYEIIIVDDGSDEESRLENLKFDKLNIIRIEPEEKTWINPCVTYNMGIKQSTGDIVVIQNPECFHMGDVLDYVKRNIRDDNYISFAAYSLDKFHSQNCFDAVFCLTPSEFKEQIANQSPYTGEGSNCWYNHHQFSPKGYHFCSAITKNNLNKLGGFDERYAHGIGFDDDDLVLRVARLPLSISIPEDPIVIHQWHYTDHFKYHENVGDLYNVNATLFQSKISGNFI
jgi:glycosyltransferase involved in cell wall biosynthesis